MANASKYYTISTLGNIELMPRKAKWALGGLCDVRAPQRDVATHSAEAGRARLCPAGVQGGAYGLALKFFTFGRRIVDNNGFVKQVRPACRNQLKTVNETVNLYIASGADMLVDQQVSRHMLRLDSSIDSSCAIYRSASDKGLHRISRRIRSRAADAADT